MGRGSSVDPRQDRINDRQRIQQVLRSPADPVQPPEHRVHKDVISRELSLNRVSAGNLAVTVNYADGAEIQVLPAIRRSNGSIRIANPGGAG